MEKNLLTSFLFKIMDQKVIDLIKNGLSINEIISKTGGNKSSIYYHYKKIRGKKFASVNISNLNSMDLGEFLGIFAGDLYQYKIRIYSGYYEKEYWTYLKNFFTRIFVKSPRSYVYLKGNVVITEYYSKDIYNLIRKYLVWGTNKTKSIRLKKLGSYDVEFLIGFLRGLFDTDGGINNAKNKTAFGTSSKFLAYQIKHILEVLELNPGFYKYKNKDFWYIDLYGQRTDKFMRLVKPNNPNKVIMRPSYSGSMRASQARRVGSIPTGRIH